MSNKLTNKDIMKIYYNLKLIEEVKQNTYQDLLLSPTTDPEIKSLALQDELELKDLIDVIKDWVDDLTEETINDEVKMIDYLKEDPYFKLVQLVYDNRDKNSTTTKKKTKKLMN